MISPEVTWIWFDLDDTLYDFRASSLIALRRVYDKYSLHRFFPDVDTWIDTYHRHNTALWLQYNVGTINQQQLRFSRFFLPLHEAGAPDDENHRLNPLLDVDYLDILGSTGLLVDGALDVIRNLRDRGYKIGILSNGFRGVQHQKLSSSGLQPLIDITLLSDDIGINKPDPRIYAHALRLSGATPAQSLMIGDNPDTDIAGALASGWHAILFNPSSTALYVNTPPVISSLYQLI